jgi:hypothetical protein
MLCRGRLRAVFRALGTGLALRQLGSSLISLSDRG